ncbi:MAG: ferric reductase-like transmembrane domain-containing protein [Rhodobacteraceae bacterium]|nr:ferric reductase-like transmembrane domain-containing protein [Paracoccaceae bacterium]
MRHLSLRSLIPVLEFMGFLAIHYIFLLGKVPDKNQIPATLGASGLTAMTLALILAARIPVIDRIMVGAGRAYRLHRWLGYTSIVVIVGHWVLASPVGTGLIPALAPSATEAGMWSAIALIFLAVASALKLVPYHIWKWSHYLMGPVYIAAVYHTFFSKIPVATAGFVWWVLVVLSLLGLAAYAWTLVRLVLKPGVYIITEVEPIKQGVDLKLVPAGPADEQHWRPGQFASISFDWRGSPERHPFTIASSARSHEMRFLIGNRGDFTAGLMTGLKRGDRVKIHEICGDFTPSYVPDRRKPQVWVAGGIGVTPFLAAVDAMVPDDGPSIDLIYSYRSLEWAVDVERLAKAAERLPQLRVHFLGTDVANAFDNETLMHLCAPGWQNGDLYVCGPEPLIDIVCSSWRDYHGQGQIHVELFDFRKALDIRLSRSPAGSPKGPADGAGEDAIVTFG